MEISALHSPVQITKPENIWNVTNFPWLIQKCFQALCRYASRVCEANIRRYTAFFLTHLSVMLTEDTERESTPCPSWQTSAIYFIFVILSWHIFFLLFLFYHKLTCKRGTVSIYLFYLPQLRESCQRGLSMCYLSCLFTFLAVKFNKNTQASKSSWPKE